MVYLFDICGTLYKSNTTYDFIGYYLKKHNRIKYLYYKSLFSLPAKIFFKILNLLGKNEGVRKFIVGFIAGADKRELDAASADFIKDFLSQKKIDVTHEMLKSKTENNERVVLVSASVDPVVKAIAQHLGVAEYCSTILEYDEGTATGRILFDLEKSKLKYLLDNQIVSENQNMAVFTDSFADLDIALVSYECTIICSANDRQKWRKILSANHKINFIDA